MATKAHSVTIDGEKYSITRVNPFDNLRLATLGLRVLGPLLKALAASESAREFIGHFMSDTEDSKAAVDKLLDTEVFTAILGIVGMTADDLIQSVEAEHLRTAIEVGVLGHVATPAGGAPLLNIDDAVTYFDVMSPRMSKHGALHQLKLLLEVVVLNLGPTTAGPRIDGPAEEVSAH